MANHPTERQLRSFYQGVKRTFDVLQEREADAVLLPLRGAELIAKSLTMIYELEGVEKPEFIYLKVGEFEKEGRRKLSEEDVVNETKKQIDESETSKKISPNFVLVDEAMSGGSISKHSGRIRNYLKKEYPQAKFHAIAVKQKHVKVDDAPRYLKLCEEGVMTQVDIERSFYTDKEDFLHSLTVNGDGRLHLSKGGELFKRLDVYTDLQLRHRGIREQKVGERKRRRN